MSVKTCVTSNEKVEYKIIDEHGRSITPTRANPANDNILVKKNSMLQE